MCEGRVVLGVTSGNAGGWAGAGEAQLARGDVKDAKPKGEVQIVLVAHQEHIVHRGDHGAGIAEIDMRQAIGPQDLDGAHREARPRLRRDPQTSSM